MTDTNEIPLGDMEAKELHPDNVAALGSSNQATIEAGGISADIISEDSRQRTPNKESGAAEDPLSSLPNASPLVNPVAESAPPESAVPVNTSATPDTLPETGAEVVEGVSADVVAEIPRNSEEGTVSETGNDEVPPVVHCPEIDQDASGEEARPESIEPRVATEEEITELSEWMLGYEPIHEGVEKATEHGQFLVFGDARTKPVGRIWFLGDIHGDAKAVVNAFHVIREREGDGEYRVVFLGDLFDRNEEDGGFTAVVEFLREYRKGAGRVVWIAGNHDRALRWDEDEEAFTSGVQPSEFWMWLNAHLERKDFGQALAGLIAKLPVAATLPGGVLATHGGFPHSDIAKQLKRVGQLEHAFCTGDFTFARVVDAEWKEPSRIHSGHEEGSGNFGVFREALKRIADIEVERVVCAHQHEVDGECRGARWLGTHWNPPALCLYSCSTLDAVYQRNGREKAVPCMARLEPDGMLEIEEIPV